MDSYKFYKITKSTLETLSKQRGIEDLEKYYELTDFSPNSFLNKLTGKAQIFAQMAFHA